MMSKGYLLRLRYKILFTVLILLLAMLWSMEGKEALALEADITLGEGKPEIIQTEMAFLFLGIQEHRLIVRKRYRFTCEWHDETNAQQDEAMIYLPSGMIGETTVTLQSAESRIPLEYIQVTSEGQYRLDATLAPGENLVDVEYQISFHPMGDVYEERFFAPINAFRIFTYPLNFLVLSDNVISLGIDSQVGVNRYRTRDDFEPGDRLRLALHSIGSPEDHLAHVERGTIREVPPIMNRHQIPLILGLTVFLLVVALSLQGSTERLDPAILSLDSEQLEKKRRILTEALTHLDAQYEAGLLPRRSYEKQKQRMTIQIHAITEKLKP